MATQQYNSIVLARQCPDSQVQTGLSTIASHSMKKFLKLPQLYEEWFAEAIAEVHVSTYLDRVACYKYTNKRIIQVLEYMLKVA